MVKSSQVDTFLLLHAEFAQTYILHILTRHVLCFLLVSSFSFVFCFFHKIIWQNENHYMGNSYECLSTAKF